MNKTPFLHLLTVFALTFSVSVYANLAKIQVPSRGKGNGIMQTLKTMATILLFS